MGSFNIFQHKFLPAVIKLIIIESEIADPDSAACKSSRLYD